MISVGRLSLKDQSSRNIRKCTPQRGPINAMGVGMPSEESSASFSIRESTLGRNPTNVMNVAKPSDRGQILVNTRESIIEVIPIHVKGVGSHLHRTQLLFPEKAMATHFSTLALKIPWMEESVGCSPGGRKESDRTGVIVGNLSDLVLAHLSGTETTGHLKLNKNKSVCGGVLWVALCPPKDNTENLTTGTCECDCILEKGSLDMHSI